MKRFTNSQLHRKYVRGILICFVMTPKRWIESTGAIGIISKPVRYGAACSAMSTGPFATMRSSFTLFANRFSRIYLSSAASLRHHLLRLTPGIRSAYLQFVLVGNCYRASIVGNFPNLNWNSVGVNCPKLERGLSLLYIHALI